MPTSLVLTVIGDDRPGLVEVLSRTIASHGGNWLESRMAHLAGKFAGVLRVSVGEGDAEALKRSLAGLESRGLKVAVEPGRGAGTERRGVPIMLELVGADHPGIVRDVSATLARLFVNVEELETETTSAPMSGQPLFKATARLELPAELSLEALRRDLERVAHDVMVDLALVPGDSQPR